MLLFPYIVFIILINLLGYTNTVIKSINEELTTNMSGMFMIFIFLFPVMIMQGISEIISKLDKLNK